MGWLETITVAITQKESKTPMSFYTRLLWIVAAMILGPLYAPIDAAYKPAFLIVGIVMAVGLAVWVSVFSWKKPKNLLYGAETHLEEFKVEAKRAGTGKTLPPRAPLNQAQENVIPNQ